MPLSRAVNTVARFATGQNWHYYQAIVAWPPLVWLRAVATGDWEQEPVAADLELMGQMSADNLEAGTLNAADLRVMGGVKFGGGNGNS